MRDYRTGARNMRLFADDLIATGEVRPELSRDVVADTVWSMNASEFYVLRAARLTA